MVQKYKRSARISQLKNRNYTGNYYPTDVSPLEACISCDIILLFWKPRIISPMILYKENISILFLFLIGPGAGKKRKEKMGSFSLELQKTSMICVFIWHSHIFKKKVLTHPKNVKLFCWIKMWLKTDREKCPYYWGTKKHSLIFMTLADKWYTYFSDSKSPCSSNFTVCLINLHCLMSGVGFQKTSELSVFLSLIKTSLSYI